MSSVTWCRQKLQERTLAGDLDAANDYSSLLALWSDRLGEYMDLSKYFVEHNNKE